VLILIVFAAVKYYEVNGEFDKWVDRLEAPSKINHLDYHSACPGGYPPINWRCEDGAHI